MIQSDLKQVSNEWNSHLIRRGRSAETPHGVPEELYFLPQIQGAEDYKKDYDVHDMNVAAQHVEIVNVASPFGISQEFTSVVNIIMSQDGKTIPSNPREAIALYIHLCNEII